jgi:hypothetical protein
MGNTLRRTATTCYDCNTTAPPGTLLNEKGMWFCDQCQTAMIERSNRMHDSLRRRYQ